MEVVKFTEEELQSIRSIQEEYSTVGIQLVQLTLAKKQTQEYLEALEQEEQSITQEIQNINTKEKELTDALNEKYGVGSLDMTTGEFTPNS